MVNGSWFMVYGLGLGVTVSETGIGVGGTIHHTPYTIHHKP